MFRVYEAMAIAITAGIGASDVLAGSSQDGVVYFMETIIEAGFRVQPALPAAGVGLQARPSASGDQMVLDFRSTAMRTVPVDMSAEARGVSSLRPLRVGDIRSKADVLTKYGDFKASLLMANNDTLTLSCAPRVEPTLAVMTLSYQ